MGNGGSKVGKSKVYREGNHRNFAACFYEHNNFESENDGETGWGCENRGEWADGPYNHHNDKYSSATVQPGNVAVLYDHRDFQGEKRVLKPGEHPDFGRINFHDRNSSIRILPDCDDWNHVWNGECDKRMDIFPGLNNTRKDFCNHNKDHAFRNECNNWCNQNGGQCSLRDRFNKCAKYEIPDHECNENKVNEMENKCVQLGFMEQTTKNIIGGNVCTNKSINDFLNECRQYIPKYVSSESACTSTGVAEAKRLKQADEAAELQRKQAAEEAERNRKAQEEAAAKLVEAQRESDRKRAEETKQLQEETKKQREEAQKKTEAMILSIVDPSALPPKLQERALKEQDGDEKTKMMMIIAIVVVVILLLSSMSMLFMGGDE